jgi:TrkA domain protein
MSEVRETKLPGVGVRHEFTTQVGQDVGVIVHHDGRREILVYDEADPDACSSMMRLSGSDTQTLAELLGASHVTETVAAVQQEIEGLGIEWVDLPDDSPALGTTIGDGEFRTKTGASIVAVMRGGSSVPAPGPEFSFSAGDVVVAVGTLEGLASLRRLLNP